MATTESAEDCLLCLEPLPTVIWRFAERHQLYCCGKQICASCQDERIAYVDKWYDEARAAMAAASGASLEEMQIDLAEIRNTLNCPICRIPEPTTDSAAFELVKSRVDSHDWGWAHYLLGSFYIHGNGAPQNQVAAFQHYLQAAEKGNVPGQADVAKCYYMGVGVERSVTLAEFWCRKAAIAGHAHAEALLGQILQILNRPAEALKWLNNSANQGYPRAKAQLAECYLCGYGVDECSIRALEFAEQGLDESDPTSMLTYAKALLKRCKDEIGGNIHRAGRSVAPAALFWARKAVAGGELLARKTVYELESDFNRDCKQCGSQDGVSLRCTRCKAVKYCSKNCQRAHWRVGHKWDCVDEQGRRTSRTTPTQSPASTVE